MTSPSPRDLNRAAVMDLAMRHANLTRNNAVEMSGLSKATISRVVDELLADGMLVEGGDNQTIGRGRPSRFLTAAPELGMVIGVDMGITTTRMLVADLNGTVLATVKRPTRNGLRARAHGQWLAKQIAGSARQAAMPHAPLLQTTVSVPGKIDSTGQIARTAMPQLADHDLRGQLARELGCDVRLENDANMALRGEMTDGAAVGCPNVGMFVVSTALSAAVAIDRAILKGNRAVLGDIGRLPFEGTRCLSDVLSVSGIEHAAAANGHAIQLDELVAEPAGHPAVAKIRDDFTEGMALAISAMLLVVDPDLIVFNGRLLPLLEQLLDPITERVTSIVPAVPPLQLSQADGFSGTRGALTVALEQARKLIRERTLDRAS
ncbi:ROK family protein [Mycolicibacterium sp. HK-90]|uniref:ROK family protein n=1 Tax=Mycolicibacterium sp. HK-90 TaxID=3056937 RepID=UPI00265B2496|nr:ROK family protein [Mycolicibacterium sp. HK-90]WKG03969.1 ROK family protein [Mycolicibacterium sp. HK-90]